MMLNKTIRYCLLTAILICLSTTAHSLEISKQPAGNAGDKNPATFKFSATNADRQLTKKDGTYISRQDVSSLYNSTSGNGMRIYDNGIDVCSVEYANLENKKKPIGMDLSDIANWQDITINPGEVGIDPTLGRFKFSTGKAGTITVVGKYTGSGESYSGVYTNGNYAYLAEGSKGMYVLDVSNPLSPKRVGMYELGGNIYGLAGDSRYIYIFNYQTYSDAGAATSVRIIDVSNPGTPTAIGNFGVSSRVYALYPVGNYVFVAHINGVRVVDVSDPKKPFSRGVYEQTSRNTVYDVYVRGDYAYLAHATTGLRILNVSDPSNLKDVGQYPLTSYKAGSVAYAVYVSGNYAYISYGASGLKIIDISNPQAPVLVGKYDTGIDNESFYKTYVRGNYAYVISYKKDPMLFNIYCLRVLDISNPKEPKLIQLYKENIGKPMFDSYDISLSKGLAYVTDASNAMRILEVPMPSELPLGSVTVDYNFVVEPLKIILTSPNGGEVWSGKTSNDVTWNIIGGVPPYKVSLYYSTDSGKTFDNTIVSDMPLPSFPWTVPGTNTLNLRVKAVVTDVTGATADDMSNGDVRIDSIQPLVTKTNIPDGERDVLLNSTITVTFSKPMNQAMTQLAISISPNISNKTFGWSDDNKQLTITHSGFSENTTYTCTISTNARDITSPGNRLKDNYQWSFRTIVPPPGSISITSNIKNASIYLDGSLVGTGSLIINDVSVGSHTLSIQKANYHPWQQVVLVKSKQTSIIYATLTSTIDTSLFFDTQEQGTVGVGETFTVTIGVKKAVNLTNMDLFISFDPELLEVLGIKDTAFIPKIASRYGTGSISYGAGVMNGSITGDGTMAEVVFMAKKKGEAILSFDIDENTNRRTSLISGVNDMPFMTESKNITIAEFGQVDGYAAIDIPRLGTYSGIYIDIPTTKLKTMTNAAGYFLLKRIPPGRVNIRANGSGLAPDMWKDIEVIGQQTTTIGTITLINGDADGDGRVNTMDFSLLREAYFKTKDDAGWLDTGALNRDGYINADFNGDNKVNTEDFAILRDNYFKAVGETGLANKQLAPMLIDNNGQGEVSKKTAHLMIKLPQDMDKINVKAEFPVYIKVENVSSMSNMDFFLAFDPAVLSVNRISGNAFLPKITSSIKNGSGFVSHAAGLMTGSVNGEGTIATVYFVLNKKQNTEIRFMQDAAKNRETIIMSTERKVIPFTSEPATLLFNGSNTVVGTSSQGQPLPLQQGTKTTTSVTTITESMGTSATPPASLTKTAAQLVGSMTLVANLKPDGMSYGIFLKDNYAYMSNESGGMQIIDVSNPSLPMLVGGYKTRTPCRDTYVVGNYAYLANGVGGLGILDVSNVTKPVLVSNIAIDGFCHDVAVSGNYAYLAAAQAGLQIVDISKMQTPKKIGKYNTAAIARGVCVRDGYAFVVDSTGLKIIDVSNPYGPKLVGSCATPSIAYDIYLAGKYAYIADNSGGLQIIDISNLARPYIVGSYKTNGIAWDVMVRDNLAFVVCESAGLYVIDVADPYRPALAGKFDTGGKAFGVAVGDGYIFVADDYQGLKVIRAEGIRRQETEGRIQATEGVATKTTDSIASFQLADMGNKGGGGNQQTIEGVATKTTVIGKPMDMGNKDDGGNQQTTGSNSMTGNTTVVSRPETGSAGKQITDSNLSIITQDNPATGVDVLPIDNYVPDVLLDTWSLSLSVSANNQVGSIRLGMDPWSTDGFDEWVDIPLPPPSQGNYLQIYFPHKEWGLVFDRFSTDIRFMDKNTTQKEWVFEVQTNMLAGTRISLSLLDVFGDATGVNSQEMGIVSEIIKLKSTNPVFPWEIILTDEETGQVWNMGKEGTITFSVDNDGLKRFRLSVKLPVISKKFQPGWHMVSLPIPVSWFPVEGYVYGYDTANGYIFPNNIESGKGYWLGVSTETTVNLLNANKEIRDEVAIPLNVGWNMIGCPFAFKPDWSMAYVEKDGGRKGLKESIEAGLVNGILYRYIDGNYKVADSIEPWEGYWFAALTDCRLIISNIREDSNASTSALLLKPSFAKGVVLPDRWQVSLNVSAGKYQDIANGAPCLGVNPGSSIGLDSLDRLELPEPQGNFVTLRFIHPDEPNSPFNQFDWDIKPPDESIVWEFEVKSNLSGERIAITWDKEEIPKDYYLMLIDKDTKTSMVMNDENGYTYICSSDNTSHIRHFMVRAVKTAPAQRQAEMISDLSLLKIWPNPATKPSMNFSWGTGKATIKIFTLNGELIRTMPDVDSGVSWDLKNNDSQSVASGVYLFVINNATNRRYGKLAVIR